MARQGCYTGCVQQAEWLRQVTLSGLRCAPLPEIIRVWGLGPGTFIYGLQWLLCRQEASVPPVGFLFTLWPQGDQHIYNPQIPMTPQPLFDPMLSSTSCLVTLSLLQPSGIVTISHMQKSRLQEG